MSMQQGSSGLTPSFPSGRTSPYGGGPSLSPSNSLLGHHSSSTGQIQSQTGATGRGTSGGMWSNNQSDPFADLGNVKPGGATRASSSPSRPQPAAAAPQTNNQKQSRAQSVPGGHQQSGKKPSYQPNYSGSVLGDRTERGPRLKSGVREPLKKDVFGDLLGGFNKTPQGPKTLKDMKKESDIEGSLSPDQARVKDWAEGKERNIRALISSLHTILWEGEARWSECGMHQLVQPEQVKKMYRKACLSVHPDKAQNTPHETLARAIFDELNDAYARFEESGAKPLY